MTDLAEAVWSGEESRVLSLLAEGADPNEAVTENGLRSLNDAIETDQPNMILLLIRHGASVNYATEDGWTPLHHAVDAEGDFQKQGGVPADLRLIGPLLAAGADPFVETEGRYESPDELARIYRHDLALNRFDGLRGSAE